MSLIFLSFTVPTVTKQELTADPIEEMYSIVWASLLPLPLPWLPLPLPLLLPLPLEAKVLAAEGGLVAPGGPGICLASEPLYQLKVMQLGRGGCWASGTPVDE
mgnify:CR=1 FL=1